MSALGDSTDINKQVMPRVAAASPDANGSITKGDDKANHIEEDDEDEVDIGKRTRRLAMNRITARERRRRKRQHLEDLENEVEKLTILNENLKRVNGEIRVQINTVAMALNSSSTQSISSSLSIQQMLASQNQILSQQPVGVNPLMNPSSFNPQSLETLSILQRLQQVGGQAGGQSGNADSYLLALQQGTSSRSQLNDTQNTIHPENRASQSKTAESGLPNSNLAVLQRLMNEKQGSSITR